MFFCMRASVRKNDQYDLLRKVRTKLDKLEIPAYLPGFLRSPFVKSTCSHRQVSPEQWGGPHS